MTQAIKRIRRKELREPDEFVSLSRGAISWAGRHARVVQIAGGVLLAVLLLIGGVRWYLQSRTNAAARQFYGANELFKREQWDAAQQAFADLAKAYDSTPYGNLAKLYAGRAALHANHPADAAPFLREFVAAAPSPAFEQLGRVALASALDGSGDANGAREQLARALELDGPLRPEATIALARAEEAAGSRDKAIELYQKYLGDDPEGASADLARARLAALGVKPPPAPPSALSFPPNGGLTMPQIKLQ